jgi:hypothetical protein
MGHPIQTGHEGQREGERLAVDEAMACRVVLGRLFSVGWWARPSPGFNPARPPRGSVSAPAPRLPATFSPFLVFGLPRQAEIGGRGLMCLDNLGGHGV